VAFRPHLSMGLALSQITNDFVRLPSGTNLREATFKVFEIGPLHNYLGKAALTEKFTNLDLLLHFLQCSNYLIDRKH
jgi:hypothetical protein